MMAVTWYFGKYAHNSHAFREGEKVSVCGGSRLRYRKGGRRGRCRACTRMLGQL